MITARHQFETIPAFTVIAGCSLGTWSDRESALAMLDAMAAVGHDVTKHYRELAQDTDDNIDLDWYSDLAVDVLCDHTPKYTYIGWQDGEFTVLPNVEEALEDLESGDELPDCRPVEGYFCLVNDHGNVTLYRWSGNDVTSADDWSEIWAVA
tara:strand:- start:2444 stop:2899 length:456 start_codon:yes stop_codon:yes gene_type:complete